MGADVTVAVQVDPALYSAAASASAASSSAGALPSPDKAKGAAGGAGGVEVRLEAARAVVVRGEKEGGVAEGGLRRVGFEIGEWVRGWEEREEKGGRRGS